MSSDTTIKTKCDPRNLGVLCYTNGATVWNYKTESINAPFEPGFFSPVLDLIGVYDTILITALDGARWCRVVSADPVVVEGF